MFQGFVNASTVFGIEFHLFVFLFYKNYFIGKKEVLTLGEDKFNVTQYYLFLLNLRINSMFYV